VTDDDASTTTTTTTTTNTCSWPGGEHHSNQHHTSSTIIPSIDCQRNFHTVGTACSYTFVGFVVSLCFFGQRFFHTLCDRHHMATAVLLRCKNQTKQKSDDRPIIAVGIAVLCWMNHHHHFRTTTCHTRLHFRSFQTQYNYEAGGRPND
jgi:hypothetical protein